MHVIPDPAVLPSSGPTRAVVVVLHGGKATSGAPSRAWHLSSLRMVPIAWRAHRRLADEGVAVWRVRYRLRGWNAPHAHPAQDAAHVLGLIEQAHPDASIVLLGHSMGGRAALAVADHPGVSGVVALAPWLPEDEPVRTAERDVVLIHGDRDRWTDPAGTHAFAVRAQAGARTLRSVDIHGAGHFMVRRLRAWTRAIDDALDHCLHPVLDESMSLERASRAVDG